MSLEWNGSDSSIGSSGTSATDTMGDVQRILQVTAGAVSQDSSSLTKLKQAELAKIRAITLKENALVYDKLYEHTLTREEKLAEIHEGENSSVGDFFEDVGAWFSDDTALEIDRWGKDIDAEAERFGDKVADIFGW